MGIVERARELRKQIEVNASGMDEATAVDFVELFPAWSGNGFSYAVNDRVRYNDTLYKVLQAHTSQSTWTPEAAVSLFAKVLPGQDGTEIGDWVKPNATNPYNKGDKVRFEGKIYESLIDGNVWSPSAYPAGWQEVT